MSSTQTQSKRKPGMQTVVRTKPFPFAVSIGFYAGIIWGGFRWLFYSFGFTEVVPGFLLEPFFPRDFLAGTAGGFLGTASFIALSIAASLVYMLIGVNKRVKGPWPGIAYGLFWFLALYVLAGPLLGLIPPLGVNDWNSIWVDGCLFVLWGLFIGYTITYEFTEEIERDSEPMLVNLQ